MPKTVLFYRHFRGFSGGHLKVADYIAHVRSNPAYQPIIFVDPRSEPSQLWQDAEPAGAQFEPERADILFLAGLDWQAVPEGIETSVPVVNLIQGLRHADPENVRYDFLARHATRICVSHEVAAAITATGQCNGTVHVIAAALKAEEFQANTNRSIDVFIAGMKAPELALAVADRLQGHGLRVVVETGQIPRAEFLDKLHDARIAVTLPYEREGFFLPALEAMAAGCLVVCPDAIGNRDICIDGESCLMPSARAADVVPAVMSLVADTDMSRKLLAGGKRVASRHITTAERDPFLRILNSISPRNIILTGLPRSGTTLTCSLLGQLPDVVALNEPMKPMELGAASGPEFVERVVDFFDAMRLQIKTHGTAISKSQHRKVPRNPLGDDLVDGRRVTNIDGEIIDVRNVISARFDLCIKHPAMFTARLPVLAPVFDCYAIVRNPLSVLLSWRDSGMAHGGGRSPAAESHDPELAARLAESDDVLERQIAMLDYMFARYRTYIPDRTLRYEDLVASGGAALSAIVPSAKNIAEDLLSRNKRLLSTDPDAIKIAHRLLETDHACWSFYDRDSVRAMVSVTCK
ncbi:glycosyltransferase [Cypionkella sinensis]|uniref:glycosyltransferase n=1 Tax=Cypionkella sinensis TaxID=1756043 RepID=UPI00362F19A3